MEAIFDQHIGIFENAVPKEWCENVIDLFNKNPHNQFSRQTAEKVTKLQKEDMHLALGHLNKGMAEEFAHNFFSSVYPLYLSEYKITPQILDSSMYVDDFKVQKTSPTQGYHLWHVETNALFHSHRVMAYTVYLNTVEEGGETEFLIQSRRLKPKQGTVCIFPAGYTHIHRGNPPLSGVKYIMTGWISYSPPNSPTNERFSN